MTIIEIINKFKDAPPDRTLARGLEIKAYANYVPEKPLEGKWIILDDGTGKLEAVTAKRIIFDFLKSEASKGKTLNFKGRLDKTEFGNIAFEIEEILQ